VKVFGASAGRQEKSEGRNPKPEGKPKLEIRKSRLHILGRCALRSGGCHGTPDFGLRISGFLRVSGFGFRVCQPDSVEGGHEFIISRALLPRPRDRRHRATPHPGPLPFGRGEGAASAALGAVYTANSSVTAVLIIDKMGTPGEGTRPTAPAKLSACRPGALTRRGGDRAIIRIAASVRCASASRTKTKRPGYQ